MNNKGNRHLDNLASLSSGEHSLAEVLTKAGFVPEGQKDTCPDCGRKLPQTKTEFRDNGYFEFVTYCPCGAIFTD